MKDILENHLERFSFNNISVLLNQPISLEIEDIINKIVINNLGGYCFEHNKLIHDILRSLGFDVRILVARVVNGQDIDTPRTHRITLLELDGDQYIVDAGFGAMSPKTPIKIDLSNDADQEYRIIRNKDNDLQLERSTTQGYFTLYKFDLHHYTQADCIMGNFYSSNHPNAVFVNNLVIALKLEDTTLSLRNRSYHRIGKNNTEIIDITDHRQLYSIINDDFLIPITEEESAKLFGITKK